MDQGGNAAVVGSSWTCLRCGSEKQVAFKPRSWWGAPGEEGDQGSLSSMQEVTTLCAETAPEFQQEPGQEKWLSRHHRGGPQKPSSDPWLSQCFPLDTVWTRYPHTCIPSCPPMAYSLYSHQDRAKPRAHRLPESSAEPLPACFPLLRSCLLGRAQLGVGSRRSLIQRKTGRMETSRRRAAPKAAKGSLQ